MEDPLRFFAWLQDHPLRTSSVAILPTNPDTKLLQAASEMVNDFVISPVKSEELRCRVARILEMNQGDEQSMRQRLKQEMGLAGMIGQDPGFIKVLENIPGIAASNAPVLLLGETGTGKELCAQAIHNLSSRQNGPFIPGRVAGRSLNTSPKMNCLDTDVAPLPTHTVTKKALQLWRKAARCFSTRSIPCRSQHKQSYCASSKKAYIGPWVRRDSRDLT